MQSFLRKILALGAAVGAAFGIASVSLVGKGPLPDALVLESTTNHDRVRGSPPLSNHDRAREEHHFENVASATDSSVIGDDSAQDIKETDEDDSSEKSIVSPVATEYVAPSWVRSAVGRSLGDGCRQVYLDIGSNVGVQIRKLFEPEKYIRGKKTTNLFDAAFGPADHRRKQFQESGLCAFGFEANPKHVVRLRKIEEVYNRQGWRLHFFVPRAVSDVDGNNVTLWSNRLSKTRLGASIFHKDKRFNGRPQNVTTFDFTKWFKDNIKSRTLGEESKVKPYVLAKMDIEGSEYPVLTRMMDEGLLCQGILDKMFIEWHTMSEAKGSSEIVVRRFKDKTRCQQGTITESLSLDDESYQLDGMPLPDETTPPPPQRR